MTDTQDRIIGGCKFIIHLGSKHWESDQTRRALQRLWDLISEELSEAKEPEATPEEAEKLISNTGV